MREVIVSKDNLLSKLNANMRTHVTDYEEALDGYKEKVQERLCEIKTKVGNGDYEDLNISLPKPVSYESEYKRAIAMLEMSVDVHIKLSEHEFSQYVLDEWTWKQSALLVNSSYVGAKNAQFP